MSHSHLTPPDQDAIAADDQLRTIHLLSALSPEDRDLLCAHFTAQAQEQLDDITHRMLGLIEKVVTFCCFPLAWPKIWGVIYALDLSLHQGRSMNKTARQLGSTRAGISVHARDFLEITGLPPSRWMRSELAAARSTIARRRNIHQNFTDGLREAVGKNAEVRHGAKNADLD